MASSTTCVTATASRSLFAATPSGASKWNPIEHRAFSEISKNCAGRPLRDYETEVNYISTTRTKTGLRVEAHLVKTDYPTGLKVSTRETLLVASQSRCKCSGVGQLSRLLILCDGCDRCDHGFCSGRFS